LKIIITGASGYVGRNIVPFLKDKCDALLLVGRDTGKLKQLFPDIPACTMADLPNLAKGFDRLVHLAVLNNNVQGEAAEFQAVNVELTQQLADIANECGIQQFFNISSVHVLDNRNVTHYAMSKRAAAKALEKVTDINVINIYLPFVRGAQWNGKLAFLNRLPHFLAKPLESLLLALKPSVEAKQLANYVLHTASIQQMIILSEGQSQNFAYRVIKRGLDLLFAFLVIGFLWWALLILWLLVRRGSPGPGIFAQERVGRYGKPFICYKFRTMQEGTVQAGTHEVSQASVTPLGRFLRGTKLDELPQVWNILKNEISLIGPRPGLPVQTELFKKRQAGGVFDVKPGISGLAQVNNIDMSDPEKLAQWDARYIALQSLVSDFKIVMATVKGGGQGDKIRG
jgi:lipopolysaccharide/colanic/teichoic acid biosynthesis glycosyltransferase